ncbi:LysM peptidoglycan-binding domain-containing protein [Brevibacillus sp. B_LB10_24]|uniref:LysM peptidoglycan-binding domain-containing protein n=1 Tax=Brevibacillus sp. B_LB10_24 TaxID=3380645 RepID=UPI0038B88B98
MNYVVRPGDTLYSISRRFGVPTDVIIRQNGLQPPYFLFAGQTLFIPTTTRPPGPGPGGITIADLDRRVDNLEQRVNELNRRVDRLERRVR